MDQAEEEALVTFRLSKDDAERARQQFHRYLDPSVPYAFELKDGMEVEATALVSCPPEAAYDLFLELFWKGKQAGLISPVFHDRGAHDGTGSLREIPYTLGVKEKLLRCSKPNSHQPTLIGTITYTILDGPLPMKNYLALVSFIPDDLDSGDSSLPTKTLITWRSKFQPTTAAQVLCCGGSIVRVLLSQFFRHTLSQMRDEAKRR